MRVEERTKRRKGTGGAEKRVKEGKERRDDRSESVAVKRSA